MRSLGMRILQSLLLLAGLSTLTAASAQAVEAKHLVMTLGGGVGILNMASDRADLADQAVESGAVRFAFGYAIARRWSLGIHYDRVGTTNHAGVLDHLHMTTYLLEGTYRPWVGQRATVECTLGIGTAAVALFAKDNRLPYTGTGSALAIGLRYWHMITYTLGIFAAVDHAASSSNALVVNGGTVDPDGTETYMQWNSQRITTGLLVRF